MALGYNAQASLNVSASWQTQTDGDIIGLLQQQSFPILALYGAKDVIFPTAVIERIAQQYPRCELQVYPSCGHSPQQEIPDEFNNRVLTFADAYLSHHLPTKV